MPLKHNDSQEQKIAGQYQTVNMKDKQTEAMTKKKEKDKERNASKKR